MSQTNTTMPKIFDLLLKHKSMATLGALLWVIGAGIDKLNLVQAETLYTNGSTIPGLIQYLGIALFMFGLARRKEVPDSTPAPTPPPTQ